MRISVVVAAFVFFAGVPAGAQSQKSQKYAEPTILEAIESADGTTLFVSGVNFGSQPYLTLDGIPLGGVVVVNGPLGDSTGGPSTTFTQSTTPWETVTDIKIANNWADLIDGSIDAAPLITETGFSLTGNPSVWTGTNTDGTADPSSLDCADWTVPNGSDVGRRGLYTDVGTFWIFHSSINVSCSNPFRLYCFEQ